jgi:hypothetical protein
MPKLTLEQKKARPNSSYWLKKADEIFMEQFRGLPCEFCLMLGYENREGTVFHHIIPKKKSKALRYTKRNGIILCPAHHKWGGDMAAHSDNVYIVEKWVNFFKEHFCGRDLWCRNHARDNFRYTFKEAFEAMKNGATEFSK